MFSDMEEFILSISMVIATAWIVDRFWRSFFEKRKQNIFSLTIWIIFSIFQLFFEYNRGNIQIAVTVMNAILIILISIFGYHSAGKSKYFLLVIFYAVWSLIEMFVFFLMSGTSIGKEKSDIMGVVVSKIIMIIFVYVLSIAWNKKREVFIPNLYYLFLLLIPFGSICIAINEFYSKDNTFFSTITISILLLFNVVIFEIYTKLNEIFIYEKERTVYAQQFDIISKSTAAQKKMMQEFHEEKHNLINKLIVLKSAMENSDKEMVIRNLDQIINSSHASENISNSGNSTVDALINFKYAIAKEYDIDFKLKIFIPEELPVEQCDIGIVLGNAIDNAIDAAKEWKDNQKCIEILMGVKKEAWVMIIKNPYQHDLRKDRNGNFLSTKKEKQRHGFGLNSIKKIAEKYQGEMIAETANHIFSLTVVMNLGNI